MPATVQKNPSILKGKNFFAALGACFIVLWCIIPIWNCIALLSDSNFVFFEGRSQPIWLLLLLTFLIVCFIVFCIYFLKFANGNVETEATVLTIGNIFVMLLGLALILTSMKLSGTSVKLYQSLMDCKHTDVIIHRLYEYSQVLHNIRNTADCASAYTVEECQGYEDAYPYTHILKDMEHTYRCSGFCYQPYENPVAPKWPVVPPPTSLLEEAPNATAHSSHFRRGRRQALLASHISSKSMQNPPVIPSTLFTDANYKVPCEGMLARDFKNFVGDIGFAHFFQGVFFIAIAITIGFIRLIGTCFYTVDKL